tara:strand:- start:408 stop:662 length:255 start_codon:yes stop_codon:yes gene_type:complete
MLNQTSSGETIKKTDGNTPTRMQKATSLDWLGQTLASLCWIISVFVYVDGDLSSMSNGDWLQLAAASCWMASNIASLLAIKPDK